MKTLHDFSPYIMHFTGNQAVQGPKDRFSAKGFLLVMLPWKASSALHVLHMTALLVLSFVKLSKTLLVRIRLHSVIIRAVFSFTATVRAALHSSATAP